jgi:hypothetical protein
MEANMKKAACIALAMVVLLLAHSLPGEAHVRGGIWIGPVWGPGWWGYPYSYSYPYPYYSAPPVVIRQEPEYVQQAPQPQPAQQYWYFCPDPQGYYPYVKKCPKGWLKVVPTPSQTEPSEPKE